jgi:hypothetical protein
LNTEIDSPERKNSVDDGAEERLVETPTKADDEDYLDDETIETKSESSSKRFVKFSSFASGIRKRRERQRQRKRQTSSSVCLAVDVRQYQRFYRGIKQMCGTMTIPCPKPKECATQCLNGDVHFSVQCRCHGAWNTPDFSLIRY